MFFSCRFQSIGFSLLALTLGLRFSKARAQFFPGGLSGLCVEAVEGVGLVEDCWRAIQNAREGMYLILTG
jgi:hypothetical protein